MKKILIATLFVLSILPAIGQDSTKAHFNAASFMDSFSSRWENNLIVIDRHKIAVDRDTIPVIMLICDTSSSRWVDSGIVNGKLVQIGEWHKNYHNKEAYWQYGYSVREFAGYWDASQSTYLVFRQEPYYRHIEYLGEDKKPLFYKIVWMAKEVGK